MREAVNMTIENIIVALIVLAAFSYAGSMLWNKIGAFSAKKACDTDCGCGTKSEKVVQ